MDTLLTDELWNSIVLFLPEHVPSPKGGRRRVPDKDCLRGILFVLREGIRWHLIPIQTIYLDRYKGTGIADGVRILQKLVGWRLSQ